MEEMSTKKSMFIIWLVATVLWIAFSSYMFRLDHVQFAYDRYSYYGQKVARGQRADPRQWGYHNRSYKRAQKMVMKANHDLTMFLLIGIGFPGRMLAVGTIALENVDKPKGRKNS